MLYDYRMTLTPGYVPGASVTGVRSITDNAVQPLEHRIESLELACAGMWELLKTKFDCTDDELVAKIHEIDARDGVVDGRIGSNTHSHCPNCHRQLLTKRSALCNWCGAVLPVEPFKSAG